MGEEPKVHEELLQQRLPRGEQANCTEPEDWHHGGDIRTIMLIIIIVKTRIIIDHNHDDADDVTIDYSYPRASCW